MYRIHYFCRNQKPLLLAAVLVLGLFSEEAAQHKRPRGEAGAKWVWLLALPPVQYPSFKNELLKLAPVTLESVSIISIVGNPTASLRLAIMTLRKALGNNCRSRPVVA